MFNPDGTIYSTRWERTIKQSNAARGYKHVTLLDDSGKRVTHLVHRLIATEHIPNPEGKPEVNHINGIKDDNRACNLEWCTSAENLAHARATGLRKSFPTDLVHKVKELRKKFKVCDIAIDLNISTRQVYKLLSCS